MRRGRLRGRHTPPSQAGRGADAFHATGAELNVARQRDPHPINEAFLAAAEELQYPARPT